VMLSNNSGERPATQTYRQTRLAYRVRSTAWLAYVLGLHMSL